MLDRNDKAWIVDTIDEKLNGAKEELREEMRGMEDRISERVAERVTADVTEKVTERVTTNVMTVFENTYGEYIKLIAELVPDKARSYDRIEEKQERQQADIEMLKVITKDQEKRISTLEQGMA